MKKIFFSLLMLSSLSFAQLMGPKLTLLENTFDFGDIKQGDKVTHVFVLTNTGSDLLKIEKIIPSCGCTAAMPEKTELKPGESTNLTVTFNSTGKRGKQAKLVRINTNDTEDPQTIITFRGNVFKDQEPRESSPIIHFAETQHDFGVVKEGQKVEYTFTFDNSGKTNLEIGDIKTSCGCTAALVSQKVLAPGEKGTLKVELDTSKRQGKMSRMITITSNDPGDPSKVLTIYADVQQ